MNIWALVRVLFLTQGFAHCNGGTWWKSEIPEKISTFKNSCVILPCKFFYKGFPKPSKDINAIWYKVNNGKDDIVYDSYKNGHDSRVLLIGDLQTNNCSLQIMDVQTNDATIYKYRVEIRGLDKNSYDDHVKLHVEDLPPNPSLRISNMDKVREGRNVTLTCQINYTCSTDIPELLWTPQLGHVNIHYVDQGKGVWQAESNQTFISSHDHYGKSIECQAKYSMGAMSQKITSTLIIIYKPKILHKSHCRQRLHRFQCKCVVISNPNSSISWNFKDRTIIHSVEGFTVNVSFSGLMTIATLGGMSLKTGEVRCSASNMEGSVSQILPFYEEPNILQGSHCRQLWNRIKCQCLVKSNPSAYISWIIDGLNITDSGYGFTVNSSSDGHLTAISLEGIATISSIIWCTASNKEGSTSHKLSISVHRAMVALLSGVAVGILVLGFIGAVLTYKKFRASKSTRETASEFTARNNFASLSKTCGKCSRSKKSTNEDGIFYINEPCEFGLCKNEVAVYEPDPIYANF